MSIIVPSKFMFQKVKRKKLIKKSNINIIPNNLDLNFWKLMNKKLCRKKLHLSYAKKIIGYNISGINDDFIKGTDFFLNILQKLSKDKNFIFLLFGNNREDLIKNSNKNIINYGRVEDDKFVRNIYNSVDLIISTSRFESFGQVILEAQACGTCCMAFKKTGIEDIIVNHKTGYLIKQFEINNFVKKINNFFKNKHKIKRSICRKQIIRKFKTYKVIKHHQNNYKKLIENYECK